MLGRGLSASQAGLVMMAGSLAMMCAAPLSGRASDRVSPRLICCLGSFSAMLAFVFFAVTLSLPGLWPVLVFAVWFGLSAGAFLSPNNNQVMSAAPGDQQAAASGVLKTVTNFGAAVGVCLLETVFSESLPAGVIPAHPAAGSNLPAEALNHGFQNAYLAGALVMLLALGCSMLTRRGANRGPAERPEVTTHIHFQRIWRDPENECEQLRL